MKRYIPTTRYLTVLLLFFCVSDTNVSAHEFEMHELQIENIYPTAKVNIPTNSRNISSIIANVNGHQNHNDTPVLVNIQTTNTTTQPPINPEIKLRHPADLAFMLGQCIIAPLLAYYSYKTTKIAHASAAYNILGAIMSGLMTLNYSSDLSMTKQNAIIYASGTALMGAASFYGWHYYKNHQSIDRLINFYCSIADSILGGILVLQHVNESRKNARTTPKAEVVAAV